MAIQHRDIPDDQLHEVKGAATAASGQIPVATGTGTTVFQTVPFTACEFGFWDYNDTSTSITPLDLTVAGTEYQLPNNGLGVNTTNAYALPGVSHVFNTSTNYFQFSNLKLGDTVDIRIDCEITTTSANNLLNLFLELGIGLAPYKLNIDQKYFKTAATHKVVANISIYIGNLTTLNGLGRLLASCDTTGASVKVNGWFVRVLTNG